MHLYTKRTYGLRLEACFTETFFQTEVLIYTVVWVAGRKHTSSKSSRSQCEIRWANVDSNLLALSSAGKGVAPFSTHLACLRYGGGRKEGRIVTNCIKQAVEWWEKWKADPHRVTHCWRQTRRWAKGSFWVTLSPATDTHLDNFTGGMRSGSSSWNFSKWPHKISTIGSASWEFLTNTSGKPCGGEGGGEIKAKMESIFPLSSHDHQIANQWPDKATLSLHSAGPGTVSRRLREHSPMSLSHLARVHAHTHTHTPKISKQSASFLDLARLPPDLTEWTSTDAYKKAITCDAACMSVSAASHDCKPFLPPYSLPNLWRTGRLRWLAGLPLLTWGLQNLVIVDK